MELPKSATSMPAYLSAVSSHLPENVETNSDLEAQFPDWEMSRLGEKTGIFERRIAGEDETAADLACLAAENLFNSGNPALAREEVDFLILCTQTPDYFLPTSACLLQERLGLPQSCGALDVNLGCSGYVYGLSLASALIDSGQAKNVLLLNADTYSKMIRPDDRNVRTIFGDGAAASWLSAEPNAGAVSYRPGSFVFGTDGSGGENLIARAGGFRENRAESCPAHLFMNGPEIFSFTLRVVADTFAKVLGASGLSADEIDLVVPHQANAYMLKHLRDALGLDEDAFAIDMGKIGNTVSASIPLALESRDVFGVADSVKRMMLLGFGVGYSWGGCLLDRVAPDS